DETIPGLGFGDGRAPGRARLRDGSGEGAILGAGRLGPPRQMRRRGVVLARPRLLGRGSGLPRLSQTLGRPRLVLTSCSRGPASGVHTDGWAAGWAAGPVGWPRRRAGDWRSGCHTKRPRAADLRPCPELTRHRPEVFAYPRRAFALDFGSRC